MFKYYLLQFFRNIKKDKTSFFINLIGLSTGLACAILIYLWVNDELKVNKFHEKDSQLYQVMKNHQRSDGSIQTFEWMPGPLANALVDEIPEVESAVSVQYEKKQGILSVDDKHLKAIEQYAGKNFFDIFSYPLISGDKNYVLNDKNAIVISDKLAKKLFQTNENIIGKTVEWKKGEFSGIYYISGIFQEVPSTSSAQFDLIFSIDLYKAKVPLLNGWEYNSPSTYIVLKEGANINQINDKITNLIREKTNNKNDILFLRRYSDKYLFGKYENGVQSGGRITYVRLFSIVAMFILLIACVNFMNLSTAKSVRKMKEVGVKKAIGVDRKTLVAELLGESMIMAFFSFFFAILLVVLLLSPFNEITGKQLHLNIGIEAILTVLGIVLFTGFISGSYPAFYISGFNPARVLRSAKLKTSVFELWIRKGLVIFQYALSVFMIVSVFVVYKQISFIQFKDLGFDKDNIIMFKKEGLLEERSEAFLQEVRKISGVVIAADYRYDLITNPTGTFGVQWEGKNPDDKIFFKYLMVGSNFIETLGLELKDGRSFSQNYQNESSKIIFNETAIKSMGLKDPIGRVIKHGGRDWQIIAVVKDFHFESLYENLKPCFITYSPNGNNIMVKIEAGMEIATIDRLQKFYKEFNLGLPFDFKFLDDDYQSFYSSEKRVAVLSKYFAGIAILISCLGLFGLAAFTVERRRKEIGIRKVHGSSGLGIMKLVTSDFSRIVIISVAISLPISYFIMKNWLDGFAYRIELSWWFFAGAGLIALVIAWLTVGSQALKASSINPVVCLKDE